MRPIRGNRVAACRLASFRFLVPLRCRGFLLFIAALFFSDGCLKFLAGCCCIWYLFHVSSKSEVSPVSQPRLIFLLNSSQRRVQQWIASQGQEGLQLSAPQAGVLFMLERQD